MGSYNPVPQTIVFKEFLIPVKKPAAKAPAPGPNYLMHRSFLENVTSTTLPPLTVEAKPLSTGERLVRWGLVAALHGVLLYGILHFSGRQEEQAPLPTIAVRLLPVQEMKKPEPPPPPTPTVRKAVPLQPQPVLAAKAPEAPSNFAVAPQPPAPPAPAPISAPPAPAPSVAVTAARFDADYLHNPKPAYPAFSRRASEEGRVLLRVRVSAGGTAEELEIKQSSGFARLDNAAREAVTKWRFIPAKRGDEAIESWVTVPIIFALD